MPSFCLNHEQLQAFAIGALKKEALEDAADHLNSCPSCSEALSQLDAYHDDFIKDLSNSPRASASTLALDTVPPEVVTSARDVLDGCTITSSNLDLDCGRRYARMLAEGRCTIGRFELEAELGDGAFGYVFQAHDPKLDRHVAIKIQRTGSLANDEEVRRFNREAQNAAQLLHPNIVALYETGKTEDDVFFLVSEFVDGQTLEFVLQDHPIDVTQAASWIAQLAEALHYAHEQGVVHRDIKPSNIIIDQKQRPHITDFGLAKRTSVDQTMTSDGRVMGTPAYMSPEQALGDSHRVDARSDVYSLGVILYELLTRERPFQGNRRLLLLQVIDQEARPPRQLDDAIPKDLETICIKAMAKSPQRRYATAKELAEDLRRAIAGETIQARPVGPVERLWRWCQLNPIAASLMLAVTLGSALGFWHLSHLSTYFVEQTALDSARSEALMFEGVRDHYSEQIINRGKNKDRVAINYDDEPDSLPLPARYLIDIGKYISQGNSGMKVQLYGVRPWRPGPERDDFQKKALAVLQERAKEVGKELSYHTFTEQDGRRTLRYAKGQIMKDSCVQCHNGKESSPKRDWAIGDLVGVLEVSRPIDREINRTRRGLRGAFTLIGITGIVVVGLSFGLVTRRRRRWRAWGP